ncbi:MAG: GIY-YIG nuclease family protein [Crocinitomicaceae bacterium]|nr:GIY-YIG nuclease family protein [Crocinitomicaceae bacterium]
MYILYSTSKDRYYVGQSDNLEERLKSHNSGISRYTAIARDWEIVHTEKFENRTDAIKRERQIKKKKSRKYIEYLISSVGPEEFRDV